MRSSSSRRWWAVLPLVFVTYSLAYLDRANYGFAAAAGMAADLEISERMSALIGALFALGYCVFQIPGVAYAQRHSVKKLVFYCLLLWGAFATLTGVVSGAPALLAIRFGLGVAEAAVLPAMLVYVSNWFTRAERSRANSLLILGGPATVLWMSVLSGYLIEAVGWRWMFILEGLPTIVWAFLWWWLVCERPADARWLSTDEKAALAAELEREQAEVAPMRNYREAFRSRTVQVLAWQYFFWSLSFFGFVLWLPSIIKQASSMGIVQTGWLSAAPYLLAMIAMPVVSTLSDRAGSRKRFIWPSLAIGAIAFGALYFTLATSFWWSFSLLIVAGASMYAPYGPFWAIIPETLPRNVVGGAIALVNSLGSLGAFVGGYAVGALTAVTGNPLASVLLMSLSLGIAASLTGLIPARPAKTFSP
ncbi:MAG TPA: MFS transporter [Opitutus sp.]|nr:MFS transporter [Opitutus sp.]